MKDVVISPKVAAISGGVIAVGALLASVMYLRRVIKYDTPCPCMSHNLDLKNWLIIYGNKSIRRVVI
jgi:hypothetical protein